MSSIHVWMGVLALAVVSVAGDRLCKSRASGGGDAEILLQQAGERVAQLPTSIGAWRTVKDEPLEEAVTTMLQCSAHKSRVYVNDDTGETVVLMLLVGRSGPLVAHTPEVCYSSQSFETLESTNAVTVRGDGAEADIFDTVFFQSTSVAGEKQRVYFAWRPFEGRWQAPGNPRLVLGGEPMLYKLQLAAAERSASLPPDGRSNESDAVRRFLAELLPALDSILVAR